MGGLKTQLHNHKRHHGAWLAGELGISSECCENEGHDGKAIGRRSDRAVRAPLARSSLSQKNRGKAETTNKKKEDHAS